MLDLVQEDGHIEITVDVFISQEVEQADIETQESVIRVVSPTDVQFKLDDQDKEEVSPPTQLLNDDDDQDDYDNICPGGRQPDLSRGALP